jgi:hypothetical protein
VRTLLSQGRARLARWWWLLTYGMWRGYRAAQVADRWEVRSLGTLGPAPYYDYREWWKRPYGRT